MAQTTNESLRDLILRHEIRTRRFTKSVVRKIATLVRQSNQAARDRLAVRLSRTIDTGPWTTAHTEALVQELTSQAKQWRMAAEGMAVGELQDLAQYEANWQAGVINESSPIKFEIHRPDPQLLVAAVTAEPFQGRLMREWFDDMERAQVRAMSSVVRQGVVQGLGIREMARQVRDTTDLTMRHAETVVRTAVSDITSRARAATYEENKDIIREELWVSTLDGRTTPQCRALDGKRFPVGEGPHPPIHPNCRSIRIPITKSWEELGFGKLGTDTSIGERPFVADQRSVSEIPEGDRQKLVGQVPADVTYNDWLKTQPREFVEEVLGKQKAALYLDGKLPLDRFVDDNLHPLTLEELKAREPEAWSKAGLGIAPTVRMPQDIVPQPTAQPELPTAFPEALPPVLPPSRRPGPRENWNMTTHGQDFESGRRYSEEVLGVNVHTGSGEPPNSVEGTFAAVGPGELGRTRQMNIFNREAAYLAEWAGRDPVEMFEGVHFNPAAPSRGRAYTNSREFQKEFPRYRAWLQTSFSRALAEDGSDILDSEVITAQREHHARTRTVAAWDASKESHASTTVRHELGHAITTPFHMNELDQLIRRHPEAQNWRWWQETLSEYSGADQNRFEIIAEGVAKVTSRYYRRGSLPKWFEQFIDHVVKDREAWKAIPLD